MQKITPFLWLKDGQVQEAADFYKTVFKDVAADIDKIEGGFTTGTITIDGQDFMLLSGRPDGIDFTEAVSFFVTCEDQAEIDSLWAQLTADGGEESKCGWLKDRFGISWQIIPKNFSELISSPAGMQAMMQMTKIDIETLRKAGEE